MKRILPVLILLVSVCAGAQSPSIDPALQARADGGDAAAQVAVGEKVAAGSGADRSNRQISADSRQAAEWYRKAADQGNLSGIMHLAELYRNGRGVERDLALAASLYRKAAEMNDVTAQGILGVLYSFGQGVGQNYVEAYFWFELAASAGGPDQARYLANRQMAGTHITAEDLESIQDRVAQWKSTHPRTAAK